MRHQAILTLALASALMLDACGAAGSATPGPSSSPPDANPQGLDGRTFLSTGVEGRALVAGPRVHISFQDHRVAANAGCNRGGGASTVTDTTLAFGPIGLTKMGCAPDVMAVEQAVTAVLSGTIGYTIEAGTLTLNAGAVGLILRAAH